MSYVPTIAVKDILTQGDSEGKVGKWIARIQEYDMDTNQNKLIKGQWLSKIWSEVNYQALDINSLADSSVVDVEAKKARAKEVDTKIVYKYLCSECYNHIVHYLLFLSFPLNFDRTKYKALRLKAQKFFISKGQLYWKDPIGILLLWLTEEEVPKIINEFHACACGGHYSWKVTAHKILKAGFYWLTMFSDVYSMENL